MHSGQCHDAGIEHPLVKITFFKKRYDTIRKEGDSSSFFIIEFSAENTGRDTTRSVIQLLGKFGKKKVREIG
jgi:hypothetical protein